jgi:hypothetical protein
MIELARRFVINSPILFRMSTRMRVLDANDIRYGVDSEQGFRTFTTSKGIKQIIMMSASYFNSLDPSAPGMDDQTQRGIRPRFLQMLTLLLSLLTSTDLKEMAEFIEKTYGIQPNRHDLELLFAKVIPLTSINPKVFLQALVPVIDNDRKVMCNGEHDYKRVWGVFVQRLVCSGYLLPGTLDDLGHAQNSWVPKWPEGGIRSTTAFARLQHHGDKLGTFNEIPPANFYYAPEVKSLTVILTNHDTYSIHPDDHDRISTLTAGVYTLTRCDDDTTHELTITETVLNRQINEAIHLINNEAIVRFHASSKSRNRNLIRRKRDPQVFPDIDAAARLSRNEAMLGGDRLAVAYKIAGKNIPKSEALRHMYADILAIVHRELN